MAKAPKDTNPTAKTRTKTKSTKSAAKQVTKAVIKTKSTNEVRKDDVDKVKNTKPVNNTEQAEVKKPKQASSDMLLVTITNHISSIMRVIGEIDDREFSSVTEVVEIALLDLEASGKLNKQDPSSKKLRQNIKNSIIFLTDQLNAVEMAKNKY